MNMKVVKNITLLMLTILFSSCGTKSSKIVDDVLFLEDNTSSMSAGKDYFSKIEFTLLKEDKDFLVGSVDKLVKHDSLYYILDKRKTNALYSFDFNGNPRNKFSKEGMGPNEYIELYDVCVDKENEEVVLFCMPPKLIYTDFNLNIKREEVPLGEKFYDRMAIHKDKYYFYNHNQRRVDLYNPLEHTFEKYLETKKMKGDIIDSSPVFHIASDDLYFHSPGDDCIYLLSEEPQECLKLDYKNREKARDFYVSTEPQDITMEDRGLYPLPYIHTLFKYKGELSFLYTYKFMVRIWYSNKQEYVRFLPGTTAMMVEDGSLYASESYFNLKQGIVHFKDMPEYKEFMKGVDVNIDTLLNMDEEYENPVIITYTLK